MKTRLKDARNTSGMSQQEAANALGVSIGTYRNWEQGRVVMNGEQLVAAARLLGTDVDYILMLDVDEDATSEQVEELVNLFSSMSSDGQEAMLAVARGLFEVFGA